MFLLTDFAYILVGIIILMFLFTGDFFARNMCPYKKRCCYGYGPFDGPHTWKDAFPSAGGKKQSPININSCCVIAVLSETNNPIEFSREYHMPPCMLILVNDGHSVSLFPRWKNRPPKIWGGPLKGSYELVNIKFRWGPSDDDGSEHMVDLRKYSMELQVTYVEVSKCEDGTNDIVQAAEEGRCVILSYMYQVTSIGNPYLDPILDNVGENTYPFTKIPIDNIPIALLAPPFVKGYFTYKGSLTFPPCTEGVQWIIQPEPLAISSRQLSKLRQIPVPNAHSLCGNTRPIQNLNNREVMYFE